MNESAQEEDIEEDANGALLLSEGFHTAGSPTSNDYGTSSDPIPARPMSSPKAKSKMIRLQTTHLQEWSASDGLLAGKNRFLRPDARAPKHVNLTDKREVDAV